MDTSLSPPDHPEEPIKRSASAVFGLLLLFASFATFAGPANAEVVCTKMADPSSHGGLQALLNKVRDAGSADPVACIPSGTYSINSSLVIPVTMRVVGTGLTPPVINCAAATYCFDGTAGPSDVTLQDLSMDGAHKADIQIGSGAGGSPLVTGWTLTGITTTGAGQVGIAMNNASNITIANSTISGNGSTPYDPSTNPNGDFGLRANRVDGLTLQDSIISNNPTTPSPHYGFSGGSKFNTTSNLLVQRNHFTGNGGGGQLWVDISSRDFDITDNTIEEVPTAGTGLLPNDAIRVEVSCGGTDGSFIRDNELTGGTVAAIDIYDSSGITVQDNAIVVPQGANFGLRMFGNVHDVVPDTGCQQAGAFPNSNNAALGNTIDVSSTAAALNGVRTVGGGTSSGNIWSGNTYMLRHCDPASGGQWVWWDGVANQVLSYAGWRGIGQDADAGSTCTSIYPQVDSDGPFEPSWGPAGTVVVIHGSGFANVTSVKFNSVASTFSHTDDEIIATVPAGASTGPVCVKNPLNTTCSTTNFVVAPGVALSVGKSGTGEGLITSLAPNTGIDCGATCQSDFPQGSSVVLQAVADGSSTFDGWDGACSGTGTCNVTTDVAKDVTATFTLNQHTLSVAELGTGSGSVVSDVGAINCGGVCSDDYDHGTVVTLTATPDANMTFDGWGGDCSGIGTCIVMLDSAKSVTATFSLEQRTLTVTSAGVGAGVVTSDVGAINCGATCSDTYDHGTAVVLTATPDADMIFIGWTGDCTGTDSTCNVTVDATKSVTATFSYMQHTLTVTPAGTGTGSVTGVGINCPEACADDYDHGSAVTLTATPDADMTFTGWGGDCSGALTTCNLTMDAAKNVTATFTLDRHTLSVTKDGTGTGTVAANVGATNCGGICSDDYDHGTLVTLTPTADANVDFVTWSGACTGSGACVVTVDAAKSVNATFNLVQHALTVTKAGTGTGQITSNPGTINCPGTCSNNYNHGTPVVLTATPSGGSSFASWSGACTGTGACNVTMDAAKSVSATFNLPISEPPLRESDPAVAYNGWFGVADGVANGGFYRMSNVKDDSATWKSPATTSVTWVTRTGPDQGKASITIDGRSKGTVDLYSASPGSPNKVYSALANKAHTVVIKVLHTKNAASSGFNVRLDAFIVGATTTQESNTAIQYDTWKSTAHALATDGTYRSATANTATATVTFTGTSIDWKTTKGKAYGKASVKIDGVSKGTFDMYQVATAWQSIISFTGLSAGPHTMVIQVLGQKNASATSTKVVVDGFIVHA